MLRLPLKTQAFSALLFLYQQVLKQRLPWIDDIVRAKRPAKLPVVFTQAEARAVLSNMHCPPRHGNRVPLMNFGRTGVISTCTFHSCPRMLWGKRLHAIEREKQLRIQWLLNPDSAVIVKRSYPFFRLKEGGRAFLSSLANELYDCRLGRPVVPRG